MAQGPLPLREDLSQGAAQPEAWADWPFTLCALLKVAGPALAARAAGGLTFRRTLIQTGTESYRFQAAQAEHGAR